MERTPHIFLSGAEVEQWAVQQGHSLVDNSTFTTEQRRQQWQRQKEQDALPAADEIVQQHVRPEAQQQPQQQAVQNSTQHTQTVGAVAIDSAGRLAAATSTGGRTCKVRHPESCTAAVMGSTCTMSTSTPRWKGMSCC